MERLRATRLLSAVTCCGLVTCLASCPRSAPAAVNASAPERASQDARGAAHTEQPSLLQDKIPVDSGLAPPSPARDLDWFAPAGSFAALPAPTPGDWLAEHPERGQTFAQYTSSLPNRPDTQRKVIYLQPVGKVASAVSPSPQELAAFVAAFFTLDARVLPPLALGKLQVRKRRHPDTGLQLLTDDLLQALRARLPADAYCLTGMTQTDLYPDPSWNFVFGMADLRGRVGVHSLARYDPALYGERSLAARQHLVRQRAYKVLAHEIGHMFGMLHCVDFHCLMNGSNHLQETDRAPLHLCPVCLRKLQWITGAELEPRYRALLRLYAERGLRAESSWVQARVDAVRSQPGTSD